AVIFESISFCSWNPDDPYIRAGIRGDSERLFVRTSGYGFFGNEYSSPVWWFVHVVDSACAPDAATDDARPEARSAVPSRSLSATTKKYDVVGAIQNDKRNNRTNVLILKLRCCSSFAR
ncbi:unnamed protein product, partial [Hapterophycus canaliculatus]